MFTSIPLHAWTDSQWSCRLQITTFICQTDQLFSLAVIPPVVEPAIGPRHLPFCFIRKRIRLHRSIRRRASLHQCSTYLGCPRILRHSRCCLRAVLPESHLRQAHRHFRSSLRPSRRPESRRRPRTSARTGSRTPPGRTCPTGSR